METDVEIPNMFEARAKATAYATVSKVHSRLALLLLLDECDPRAETAFCREKWEELYGKPIPGLDEDLGLAAPFNALLPTRKLVANADGGSDSSYDVDDVKDGLVATALFTEFYEKYKNQFLRAARRFTSVQLAQEVLSTAAEKVWILWRSPGANRTEANFIALFKTRIYYAASNIRQKKQPDYYSPETLALMAGIESTIEWDEMMEMLHDALAKLDPIQRSVIYIRFFGEDNTSWRECAEELGLSPYQFNKICNGALKALRSLLR